MARNRNKRRTTEELVAELREFHHDEAADRLARLATLMHGRCEHCGRTDCERMK